MNGKRPACVIILNNNFIEKYPKTKVTAKPTRIWVMEKAIDEEVVVKKTIAL